MRFALLRPQAVAPVIHSHIVQRRRPAPLFLSAVPAVRPTGPVENAFRRRLLVDPQCSFFRIRIQISLPLPLVRVGNGR